MKRRRKIFSLILVMIFSASVSIAQSNNDNFVDRKSKRAKRIQAKELAAQERINENSERLIDRLTAKDLVIMDDGVRYGSYPASGLVNFFRVDGDTLTFQRKGVNLSAAQNSSNRILYKSQGLITDISIFESNSDGPTRAAIFYLDQITMEPVRALIYVFKNRFEVRNDDATGVEIRGKLRSIDEANVLEIGQNSINLLFRSNPFFHNTLR